MDIEVALSDWNMVQATLRHLPAVQKKTKKKSTKQAVKVFNRPVGSGFVRVFFGFLGLMPIYPKYRYFSGVMGHLLMAL